ncbi:hypothetical protein MMC07_002592 [Pseudocyphellaria aurata]|nr:hypothetical protein [Pseudocyphellaria aurata]
MSLPALLHPDELCEALQAHMLVRLLARDLISLAATSQVLRALAMSAASAVWCDAAVQHMPWHLPLPLPIAAIQTALQRRATVSKNVGVGKAHLSLKTHMCSPGKVVQMCLSPNQRYLAYIWQDQPGSQEVILQTGPDEQPVSFAWQTGTGMLLAFMTAGVEDRFRTWDASSGTHLSCLAIARLHADSVLLPPRWSADGT